MTTNRIIAPSGSAIESAASPLCNKRCRTIFSHASACLFLPARLYSGNETWQQFARPREMPLEHGREGVETTTLDSMIPSTETLITAKASIPRRRWGIALLLGFGVLVNYFDCVNLSVSRDALQASFGISA